MSTYPSDLLYTREHEWVRTEGDILTIGITEFAQRELGDVVFVELPEIGRTFGDGDELGTIESVKAVSEFYTPVSGTVVEINQAVIDDPELLNTDSYGEGWLIKLRTSTFDRGSLLSADDYQKYTASAEH